MKTLGNILAMALIGACLLAIWYVTMVIASFIAIIGGLWILTL